MILEHPIILDMCPVRLTSMSLSRIELTAEAFGATATQSIRESCDPILAHEKLVQRIKSHYHDRPPGLARGLIGR